MVIGGIACCTGEILTMPFDTIKVRIQVYQHKSMFRLIWEIIRNEGLGAFYQGLSAALLRQIIYGSLRLGSFSYLTRDKPDITFVQRLGYAFFTGAISISISNPTDVIKVRF